MSFKFRRPVSSAITVVEGSNPAAFSRELDRSTDTDLDGRRTADPGDFLLSRRQTTRESRGGSFKHYKASPASSEGACPALPRRTASSSRMDANANTSKPLSRDSSSHGEGGEEGGAGGGREGVVT